MQLLTSEELCRILGITRPTIYKRLAADPAFPKPIHIAPRCPRWRLADVEAWVDGLAGDAPENGA